MPPHSADDLPEDDAAADAPELETERVIDPARFQAALDWCFENRATVTFETARSGKRRVRVQTDRTDFVGRHGFIETVERAKSQHARELRRRQY